MEFYNQLDIKRIESFHLSHQVEKDFNKNIKEIGDFLQGKIINNSRLKLLVNSTEINFLGAIISFKEIFSDITLSFKNIKSI